MRKYFWVMLGCAAFAQAQAASFDCAKARSKMEKMICGDAELSRLDEDLGQAYRKAAQRQDVKQGAIESQRQWLEEVQAKCSDVACMKKAYQDRIRELGLTSSFGIVFMHAQPPSAPAAATLQAKAAAPVPEYVPPPTIGSAAPAAAAEPNVPKIPRLHLKTKPPVCKAVVEAANRNEAYKLPLDIPEGGLLIDINGDGKKERVTSEGGQAYLDYSRIHVSTKEGVPIEFNPVPEEERNTHMMDERLIKFDGKFYIYGGDYETPNYLAIIDKDYKEKIVCEFARLKPIVTIMPMNNDKLCKLGLEHRLEYVQPTGKSVEIQELEGEDVELVANEFPPTISTSLFDEMVVDIDNDGKPDRVIHVGITGGGRAPCYGDRLAVLDKTGKHLDKTVTALLPYFECNTRQAPFMFEGQSYIEAGERIVQLRNGKMQDTICAFHTQQVFGILEH